MKTFVVISGVVTLIGWGLTPIVMREIGLWAIALMLLCTAQPLASCIVGIYYWRKGQLDQNARRIMRPF